MFIFDLTNLLTLLLVTISTSLLIFLGQEVKKSSIALIPLIIFLILLVVYIVQLYLLPNDYKYLSNVIYKSLAIDFLFIFITFFSYLWVDTLEAKRKKRISLDDSFDWLWKDV